MSGSVVNGAGALVDARGGVETHLLGQPTGGDGRFLLATNTAGGFAGTVRGASRASTVGPRDPNPFVASGPATPLVPDLVGGAEAYGLTTLSASDFPSVVAGAPASAAGALLMEHLGPGDYANDFAGYDVLFVINLTNQTLTQPDLGAGAAGLEQALVAGGFTHDPAFGGDGLHPALTLGAHQVYAITVPAGTAVADFGFLVGGQPQGAATTHLTDGVPLYSAGRPTASAGGPYSVAEGGALTLDASASRGPLGVPLTYAWTVNGVPNAATGVKPTLTWARLQALGIDEGPASFPVSVQVADGAGDTASASGTIFLSVTPPTATFSGTPSVVVGGTATVLFTGPFSYSRGATAAGFHYAYDFADAGGGHFDLGDGTYAGSVTAASATVPSGFLAVAGPHAVRGRILDRDGGFTDYTWTITVRSPATVQAFQVNDGGAQRSMVDSLTITFSTQVTLGPGAFALTRTYQGATTDVSNLVHFTTSLTADGRTVAVLTFAGDGVVGASLADGRYALTTHGGAQGGDRVDQFFRLFGDVNGDGKVDATDSAAFARAYRSRAGVANYVWYLDYDANGLIDSSDYYQFLRRSGQSV